MKKVLLLVQCNYLRASNKLLNNPGRGVKDTFAKLGPPSSAGTTKYPNTHNLGSLKLLTTI